MNKTLKRVLLFFIGVPALVSIILLLPYQNHLVINIIAVAICVLGSYEMRGFYVNAGISTGNMVVPALSGLLPIAAYLETAEILPGQTTYITLILLLLFILVFQITRTKEGTYNSVLSDIASSFAIMIYPSLFLTYFIKLSSLQNASYVILTFLIIVFANDTGAYFFGSLIGGGNRGVTKISPSKSLAGFIAGPICSIGFALMCNALFPNIYGRSSGWVVPIIVGIAIAIASILGDLIESALKRSAGLKDSGSIIPGRGGVLDSVDSILFAAPVFFYLLIITL